MISQQDVKKLTLDDYSYIFGNSLHTKTEPRLHQYGTVVWGHKLNRVMLVFGIGTGKSYATILLSKFWECKKTLIVCPNSVKAVWKEQLEEHVSNPSYTELIGSKNQRRKLLETSNTEFYIINYEGLKILFGEKVIVGSKGKYIIDEKLIKKAAFTNIIIDECFIGCEKVFTDHGWIAIGDIVEKKMKVRVASYNRVTEQIEFKNIVRWIKKPLQGYLVRIKHNHGNFVCTPNHKIYIKPEYVRADNLAILDALSIIQPKLKDEKNEQFYTNKSYLRILQRVFFWRKGKKILFKKMRKQVSSKRYGNKKEKIRSFSENNIYTGIQRATFGKLQKSWLEGQKAPTTRTKTMQKLWKNFYCYLYFKTSYAKFLFSKLWDTLQSKTTGLCKSNEKIRGKKKNIREPLQTQSGTSRFRSSIFDQNEKEQSNAQPEKHKENVRSKTKSRKLGICFKRRELKEDSRTIDDCQSNGSSNGGSCCNKPCQGNTTKSSVLLFDRHSGCTDKNSHRNRWSEASFKTTKDYRQTENYCIGSSWVESVEVLERGSAGRFLGYYCKDQTVYNLEIENNHNYFLNGVLVSNCHHTRNFQSLQTHACYYISKHAKNAIMITGTPIAELVDFWSEFMVLDQGKTLGADWKQFTRDYFNKYQIKINPWLSLDKWKIKKNKKNELLDLVSEKILRYAKDECIDLPRVIYEQRNVDMSAEQRKLYYDVVNGLRIELDNGKLTLNNIINKSIKLFQIMSGFVMKKTNGSIKLAELKTNPKLVELSALLDEIDGQAVIFHHFVEEGRAIERMLKKKNIAFAAMRGEIKDKEAEYKRFKTDPNTKILLAHPLSGGEGMNLQNSNVIIFYSSAYSAPINRDQCEGRIIRAGQTKTCVIIDLIMRDPRGGETVDERKYTNTKTNQEFAKGILEYLKRK